MRRRRKRLRWLACAGFAALTTGLAAPAPSAAQAPGFYGVTPIERPTDADFARMDQANVGSLRVMFNWIDVQPTPDGPYNFTELDRVVTRAAEHGIPLLPFLYGTPYWASDCSGIPANYCDRVDPLRSAVGQNGWPAFVRALADRYGPSGTFWRGTPSQPPPPYLPITKWQVGNEANSLTFWRPRPDPAAYARLLSSTAAAIRSEDPAAQIVLGGLFFSPPKGQSMPKFLSRLYKLGASANFDAVALHPYSPDVRGIKFQLEAARKLLRKRDKGVPILVTELGWGSQKEKTKKKRKGKKGKKKKSESLYKGPKGQRALLTSSFRFLTAKRGRYNIGGIYWFSWRDLPGGAGGACILCESFGLLTSGSQAKPAMSAFTRFTGGS